MKQSLALLIVFGVTLFDHAGTPNAYVIAMAVAGSAEGSAEGLNPYAVFASGFLSVLLYENAVYWLGRYVRRTEGKARGRLTRYIQQSALHVNQWLQDGSFLWLMFGRFVAFAGLYVPFGAGHLGFKYGRFLAWTTAGSVLQMSAFGILAYQLGERFSDSIKKWGWTGLAAAVVLMALWSLFKRLRRRRKRLRSAEQTRDELQNDQSDDRREV